MSRAGRARVGDLPACNRALGRLRSSLVTRSHRAIGDEGGAMFHAVNTIRQATVALTLAVSLAVLTAPQALAGNGSSTYHDGWYGYAVALTKANQHPPMVDGRSPDTVDAALAARQRDFGPPDGWYGYAVSI